MKSLILILTILGIGFNLAAPFYHLSILSSFYLIICLMSMPSLLGMLQNGKRGIFLLVLGISFILCVGVRITLSLGTLSNLQSKISPKWLQNILIICGVNLDALKGRLPISELITGIIPDIIAIVSFILHFIANLGIDPDEIIRKENISRNSLLLLLFSVISLIGISLISFSFINLIFYIYGLFLIIYFISGNEVRNSVLDKVFLNILKAFLIIILIASYLMNCGYLDSLIISDWLKWAKIFGALSYKENKFWNYLESIIIFVNMIIIYYYFYFLEDNKIDQDKPLERKLLIEENLEIRKSVINSSEDFDNALLETKNKLENKLKNNDKPEIEHEKIGLYYILRRLASSLIFVEIVVKCFILFGILRYTTIESFLTLIWLFYFMIYQNDKSCITFLKIGYLPFTFIFIMIAYSANINNLWDFLPANSKFFTPDLCGNLGLLKFDLKHHSIPQIEFLLMIIGLIPTAYLLRLYKDKEEGDISLNKIKGIDPLSNWLVIIKFLLKYTDKVLLVCLFLIGLLDITLFNLGILVFFMLMLIYPSFVRISFSYLLSYYLIYFCAKYIYGIFIQYNWSFATINTLESIGSIFGFPTSTSIDKTAMIERILFDNYFIFVLFFIYAQYLIYESWIFEDEAIEEENELAEQEISRDKSGQKSKYSYGRKISVIESGIESTIQRILDLISSFFIWIAYIVIILIICIKDATYLNLGYMIFFSVILYIHFTSSTSTILKGFSHTKNIWLYFIFYCLLVLISLYFFQFAKVENLITIIKIIHFPKIFSSNLNIIGLEIYDVKVIRNFLLYFILLIMAVFALFKANSEFNISEESKISKQRLQRIRSMRKNTPNLVAFLDVLTHNTIHILSISVFALSIFWKLSIANFILVCMIAFFYLRINKGYRVLSNTKTQILNDPYEKFQQLSKTKDSQLELQYKLREEIWGKFFFIVLLFFVLSYIFRFSNFFYKSFQDKYNFSLYYNIWKLFGIILGLFHDESNNAEYSYLRDSFGFIILLFFSILEKYSLEWRKTQYKIKEIDQKEENLGEGLQDIKNEDSIQSEDKIQEHLKELSKVSKSDFQSELNKSENWIKSILGSITLTYFKKYYLDQTKDKEYNSLNIKLLKVVKAVIEELIIMLIIILEICKANILSIGFLILIYSTLKFGTSINIMHKLNYIVLVMICVQYLLFLLDISDIISPEGKEYQIDQLCSDIFKQLSLNFSCPFYSNFNFLTKSINSVPNYWAGFFSLGTSFMQRYLVFGDMFTMIVLVVYFQYFCHSILEEKEKIIDNNKDINAEENSSEFKMLSKMVPVKNLKFNLDKWIKYIPEQSSKFLKYKRILAGFMNSSYIILIYIWHIISILLVIILSVLSYGLFCIVYLCLGLYNLYRNFDVTLHPNKWMLPHHLKKYLVNILLVELSIQLLSSPFIYIIFTLIDIDNRPNKLIINSIIIDTFGILGIAFASYTIVIMKLILVTVIGLQQKLFNSPDFEIFTNHHAHDAKSERQLRGLCQAFLFNNRRIEKFCRHQKKRDKFDQKLEKVKETVKSWTKRFGFGLKNESKEEEKKEGILIEKENLFQLEVNDINLLYIKNKQELAKSISDKDTLSRKSLSKIGILPKIYIGVSNIINHILFHNKDKLIDLKDELRVGTIKAPSRIERLYDNLFREDIALKICEKRKEKYESLYVILKSRQEKVIEEKEVLEKEIKQIENKIIKTLEKMKEHTNNKKSIENEINKSYAILNVIKHVSMCLIRGAASKTELVCYFLLILGHFYTGSLITVVYPLSVFGYALLEKTRPSQIYWKSILLYTEFVFFVKCIMQLKLIYIATGMNPDQLNSFLEDSMRIGLTIYTNKSITYFLKYIIFDLLIIILILIHQYILIYLGLFTKREQEIEPIQIALYRLKNIDKEVDISDLNIAAEKISSFEMNFPNIKYRDESNEKYNKQLKEKNQSDNNINFLDRFFNLYYLRELFPNISNEKPGSDYTSFIFIIQLIICVVLILLYTTMSAQINSMQEALSFNSFSGTMMILLIFHIIIICFEKFLYLNVDFSPRKKYEVEEVVSVNNLHILKKNNDKDRVSKPSFINEAQAKQGLHIEVKGSYNYCLFMKYILLWFLLFFIHYLVFWSLPNEGNQKLINQPRCIQSSTTRTQCNDASSNWTIMLFYFLYCIYFALSAIQISNGWPDIRNKESLRRKYSPISYYLLTIYMSVPFLMEIAVITSWTFTSTSLDIFQHLEFEDIYTQIYTSKHIYTTYKEQKLGSPITKFMKFLFGGCGTFGIILLLIIPMLLFSSLNPISQLNPINSATSEFGISVNNWQSKYMLFHTTQSVSRPTNLAEYSTLQSLDSFKVATQNTMQDISLQPYPDDYWNPNEKVLFKLNEYLNIKSTLVSNMTFYLKTNFYRKFPIATPVSTYNSDILLSNDQKNLIKNGISKCQSQSFSVSQAYCRTLHLTNTPPPIAVDCNNWFSQGNITFVFKCQAFEDGNQMSWELHSTNPSGIVTGLEYYTVSDTITTAIETYNVITLYVSIVVVIFNIARTITAGTANRLIINDIPNPDELLAICEGVTIYRIEGKLKEEAELYYTLIDVMRSPECLKEIGGSCLEAMREAESQRIKKIKD